MIAPRDILKEVAAGTASEEAARAAALVFTDDGARRAFEDVLYPDAESELTEAERAVIRDFVSARCKAPSLEERLAGFIRRRREALIESGVGAWRLAAAAAGTGAVATKPSAGEDAAPAEDVTFVFASGAGAERGWRVSLRVLAAADADTPLDITAEDGEGRPVDGGTLRLAGVALPVVAGRTAIPLGMFLSGMKEPKVTLTFADGLEEGGTLAFM